MFNYELDPHQSPHEGGPCDRLSRVFRSAGGATWMAPTGMTSHAQAFDAREDGSFRISLTYDSPTGAGKTTTHTGTFHGRFVKLVTNEQVVEQIRAVDRIRLIKWLGTIDEQTLDRVDEAIKISRGIIRL